MKLIKLTVDELYELTLKKIENENFEMPTIDWIATTDQINGEVTKLQKFPVYLVIAYAQTSHQWDKLEKDGEMACEMIMAFCKDPHIGAPFEFTLTLKYELRRRSKLYRTKNMRLISIGKGGEFGARVYHGAGEPSIIIEKQKDTDETT